MSELWYTALTGLVSAVIGGTLVAIVTYHFNVKAKDKELQKSFEIYQAQQATKIGELLSLWTVPNVDKQKLNQLSYEMSLLLPANVYNELSKILTYAQDKKDPKDILISIRKLYKGKEDELDAGTIVHW